MEPNWKEAPEWARYWAVDKDGADWWYEDKPDIAGAKWSSATFGEVARVRKNPYPNWKQSLQERQNEQ